MKSKFSFLIFLILIQVGYSQTSSFTVKYKSLPIEITIKTPIGFNKGTILVLPGWNFSDTGWCSNTRLCELSLTKGYTLIFVEMKKSIYAARYYPESNKEYAKNPTRTWLKDSVFTILQNKYKLLQKGKNNFVLGLSTGGRGAVLLALDCPELFKGCAILSGDFDPTLEPKDPLMNGVFGSIKQFPQRWNGEDNVSKRIDSYIVPTFVGHGKADKVVPVFHSIKFYELLKKHNPNLKLILDTPENMGHNYTFWGSRIESVLNFFDGI